VESVLNQEVDDMEVILVDDGSPDNCPELCDEWAEKDTRIKVIHKTNGGLSDARNAGIDVATGDYITFVDSDDWIADNTYATLLHNMGDNDILEYPIADRLPLQNHVYHDADTYWLHSQAYLHTYAWNKLYKRSLFDDIRYPVGKVFEDVYTLPLLLRAATTIATTDKGCYHYCYNPEGITAKADGDALSMLLDAHLQSGMPIDDEYYLHLANIQSDVFEHTHTAAKLSPRRIDYRHLHGTKKIKAILLNTLGINTLCRISKFIHLFKSPSRW
jgi:glycosyltransferase involved in cell wall biosynthesis